MENCKHCPFLDAPSSCPRWPNNHTRYCAWVDPNHPDYKKNGANALLAISRKNYPAIISQISNLVKSTYQYIANHGELISEEDKEARLAICRSCHSYDANEVRCLECGCYLNIKTSISTESCPLQPPLWGPIEIKNKDQAQIQSSGCGCNKS